MWNYLIAFLKNFSQVFLVENKIFGLLILVSLFIIQPRIGIFSEKSPAFANASDGQVGFYSV
ncbi:MAG: hypothetical protein A3A94_01605 [Candidatus Portnoybacteria bacterium RIFCSPLOWO2_01_FULL_43_11]|uniref:Uncharacterized protein n=4 Tax=Candidatus Portnoyibacteriota TaxID=1817913 RepID=A0A1G2FDG4_9BACT|nr:MAG: hypothetical protein A2815_00350 [Candidatus Portnoybacteria bacterium RIFCSPHIGHO2_01_FULL_40_12b]OGZ37793.1 MAG: hypothetical protein A3E90_02125 [Candidatus Portnoybacteria bacterium RIFCSPHIGHO2_12_FULL_40_11]OGZ39161.1 MAG: hypothetical protein A3A94_01605 [Candidatus Portnoybacteria bacterium RIFCSPLOWO2_01_FULL_43_11]OGZ39891.1 MAG: hypothetical protein A3I20_02760 [Candidatus Portnoybacteria bacterium RIFCSPLOWO2_02_FULL_40_15]